MQVEHLFSYPLYRELWNLNLADSRGFVISEEDDLKKYKSFRQEQAICRGAETLKERKGVVDELQELLKGKTLITSQDADLIALLKSLNLSVDGNGCVVVEPQPVSKKYPGVQEPSLSHLERRLLKEEKAKKVEKHYLMILDQWLDQISSSRKDVKKQKYSQQMDWKELERKCRERTQRRLDEMEVKRKRLINNFHYDDDYALKKLTGIRASPMKAAQSSDAIPVTSFKRRLANDVKTERDKLMRKSTKKPQEVHKDLSSMKKETKETPDKIAKDFALTTRKKMTSFAFGISRILNPSEKEQFRKRMELFQRMLRRRIKEKQPHIKFSSSEVKFKSLEGITSFADIRRERSKKGKQGIKSKLESKKALKQPSAEKDREEPVAMKELSKSMDDLLDLVEIQPQASETGFIQAQKIFSPFPKLHRELHIPESEPEVCTLEEIANKYVLQLKEVSLKDSTDLTKSKPVRTKLSSEFSVKLPESVSVGIPLQDLEEIFAAQIISKSLESTHSESSNAVICSLDEIEDSYTSQLKEEPLKDAADFTKSKMVRTDLPSEFSVKSPKKHLVEVNLKNIEEILATKEAKSLECTEYESLDAEICSLGEIAEKYTSQLKEELLKDTTDFTKSKMVRTDLSSEFSVKSPKKNLVEIPLKYIEEILATKITESFESTQYESLEAEICSLDEIVDNYTSQLKESPLNEATDFAKSKLVITDLSSDFSVKSPKKHQVEVPIKNIEEIFASKKTKSLESTTQYESLDAEICSLDEIADKCASQLNVMKINEESLSNIDFFSKRKLEKSEIISELNVKEPEIHSVEVPFFEMMKAQKVTVSRESLKRIKKSEEQISSLEKIPDTYASLTTVSKIYGDSPKDIYSLQKLDRSSVPLGLLVKEPEKNFAEVTLEDVCEIIPEESSISYSKKMLPKGPDIHTTVEEEKTESESKLKELSAKSSREQPDSLSKYRRKRSKLDLKKLAMPITLVYGIEEDQSEITTEGQKHVKKAKEDIRADSSSVDAIAQRLEVTGTDLPDIVVEDASRLQIFDKERLRETSGSFSQTSYDVKPEAKKLESGFYSEEELIRKSKSREIKEDKYSSKPPPTIEDIVKDAGRKLSLIENKFPSEKIRSGARKKSTDPSALRSKTEVKIKTETKPAASKTDFTAGPSTSKKKLENERAKLKTETVKHEKDLKSKTERSPFQRDLHSKKIGAQTDKMQEPKRESLKDGQDPRKKSRPSEFKKDTPPVIEAAPKIPKIKRHWREFVEKKQNFADLVLEKTREMKENKGLVLNDSLYSNFGDTKTVKKN